MKVIGSKVATVCSLAATVITGIAADTWSAGDWTNSVPRAFLKDHQLRIYFNSVNECVLFTTKWKKARVPAEDFNYTAATFKREKSRGPLPAASSSWREIKVIEAARGDSLLRSFAMHLAPAEVNHGVYFQYALGDAVLFREPGGNVRLAPFETTPADVIIDRRYSRHELAAAAAGFIEKELRADYPNDTAFILLWNRRGASGRVAILDLAEREAVACYPPPDDATRATQKLGHRLGTLCSFVVVDNVWAFLKNPVSSATRTINQAIQWTATFFEPNLRQKSSAVHPVTNAPAMDLVSWEKWLDQHTGTPRERGTVRLLINGEKFYSQFERRIAEAQSNINIHVCIFDRDDVAVHMADLLKARSTNVEVKVVFDRLNSRGAGKAQPATPLPEGFVAPRSIADYLRDGGNVHVRPLLNPALTCDHSKIFLIDSRYAYIGGMNFGREYRYEWHDLMAEVEGPVVASFQNQFDKKWAQAGVWGDCALAEESMCGKTKSSSSDEQADSIELRRLYTKTFDRQIRQAQLEAIGRARSYVFLENAYLYSNDMIMALVRARLRGVDVRIILPGENDFAPGHGSNIIVANYLRLHGVRIYFYPGMSHVKALQVDGWVCFGSANSDALSLRLNREADLASSDPGFASRFSQEVFETDFAKSRELKDDVEIGWGDHVGDALLNLF